MADTVGRWAGRLGDADAESTAGRDIGYPYMVAMAE